MKRVSMTAGFVLYGLLYLALAPVQADQFCWRLQDGSGTPLLDAVRMAVTGMPNTSPSIFSLCGDVNAAPLYQQGGCGSATQNAIDLTQYRVTLTLGHTAPPGFFNNNRVCALTLLITADPTAENFLDGTWSSQCVGGLTGQPTNPTNVSGLVQSFACPVFGPAFAQAQQGVATQVHTAFGIKRNPRPSIAQEDVAAYQMNAFGELRAAGLGNFEPLHKE
jgi:hypothetical protein